MTGFGSHQHQPTGLSNQQQENRSQTARQQHSSNQNSSQQHQASIKINNSTTNNPLNYATPTHSSSSSLPLNVINCSSLAFQQIKQTQASLARLSRHVHFNNNNNNSNLQNNNNNSQVISQSQAANHAKSTHSADHQASQISNNNNNNAKSTTFVDCLIRRFKNCFNEDFCEVPVFVVGNLSPGSDGTHLILPPCVSLEGQNISRFASAKNLRLLTSIRESCRSIEQLDLGGNKLNDLIEIYKILQCTPNLKFLNLSENDLSRTAPVATATSSSSTSTSINNSYSTTSNNNNNNYSSPHWSNPAVSISFGSAVSSSSMMQQQTRAQHQQPLAAISQNSAATNFASSRRHSSLGQPSSSSSLTTRPSSSRVAEARRLAAVAQSRKTPTSMVNSRLVAAAAASNPASPGSSSTAGCTTKTGINNHHSGSQHRLCTKNAASMTNLSNGFRSTATAARTMDAASAVASGAPSTSSKTCEGLHNKRNVPSTPIRTKSTMHLVRSLSSLSAKDVRLGVGARKSSDLHRESNVSKNRLNVSSGRLCQAAKTRQQTMIGGATGATSRPQINHCSTTTTSGVVQNKLDRRKLTNLAAEPINEMSDDVDMIISSEISQPTNETSTTGSANQQQAAAAPTTTPTGSPSNNNATTIVNNSNANSMRQLQTGISTVKHNNHPSASLLMNSNTPTTTTTIITQQQHPFKRTFESIKALALNNTGCQWRVVCSILSRMPNLEELHLSLNNYERIDLDPNLEFRHTSLKRLYLCNNPKLTDWKELNKILIAFPSLEALSIADCNISQIPENLAQSREWRKICGLNINGWPIKEWPVIERLNELPSLIDLKCRNLELLNTIDEPRDHLIARLPNLQRLNGSEIEERDHAEKAFLRFFVTNSHLERPQRFHELIQIHGLVDAQVDVDVDLSPPSQANIRVVYLNRNYFRQNNQDDILMSEDFLNKLMATPEAATNGGDQDHEDQVDNENQQMKAAGSSSLNNNRHGNELGAAKLMKLFKDESQEVVSFNVDLRQSVRKFKQIIGRIFGLEGRQNFALYYIDHEMVGLMGPELIKHNQKKLWNYNVQDGDQFIVEEI